MKRMKLFPTLAGVKARIWIISIPMGAPLELPKDTRSGASIGRSFLHGIRQPGNNFLARFDFGLFGFCLVFIFLALRNRNV